MPVLSTRPPSKEDVRSSPLTWIKETEEEFDKTWTLDENFEIVRRPEPVQWLTLEQNLRSTWPPDPPKEKK